jgi:hypothetical protein
VGELEVAVTELRAGQVLDGGRVRRRGAVGRAVVGDDDLGRETAGAEVFRAASEARR